jgi:hypothetical protein
LYYTAILYACETETVYSSHARKLNPIHMGCLRKQLQLKCYVIIPDTKVLTHSGITSTSIKGTTKMGWSMVRMSDHRLPKKLLYGELQVEKRSHGGQKKRYKDTLVVSLKHFCTDCADWENMPNDGFVAGAVRLVQMLPKPKRTEYMR